MDGEGVHLAAMALATDHDRPDESTFVLGNKKVLAISRPLEIEVPLGAPSWAGEHGSRPEGDERLPIVWLR